LQEVTDSAFYRLHYVALKLLKNLLNKLAAKRKIYYFTAWEEGNLEILSKSIRGSE